jgi:hypothetical protein
MAKTTQINDVRVDEGMFHGTISIDNMSVKGGALPASYQTFIAVELDFDGVDPVRVAEVVCGGQSLRVILQARLRKMSTDVLDGYARDGLKVPVGELLEREGRKAKNPEQAGRSAFTQMTREQKLTFLVETCKVPLEVAEAQLPRDLDEE